MEQSYNFDDDESDGLYEILNPPDSRRVFLSVCV